MEGVHTHFLWIDWAVLAAYLLLTTWIGHALRGKQSTMQDFFLAGRSLLWPAASGSIIATEISAITFVGVPRMVFAAPLFVYYQQRPPTPAEAALFAKDTHSVFPVWITTVLPPGLSGLILAGAFAAAISSLDSALAALSQTSMALWHGKDRLEAADQRRLLVQSRSAVVGWGIALILMAVGLQAVRGQINLLSLAFGMVAYTYGPMVAAFLLALSPLRRNIRGIVIGTIISVLLVMWARPDLYNILAALGAITPEQAAAWRPKINFAWLYPIT